MKKHFLYKLSLKKTKTDFESVKIKSSLDINELARKFYEDDLTIYESFFLVLLNRYNKTIAYVKLGQGGRHATIVDVPFIAKYAIETLCSAVILVHNHPSGNPAPSDSDQVITDKIKKGLSLFDIEVLDHIILTEDSYFSFRDDGLI